LEFTKKNSYTGKPLLLMHMNSCLWRGFFVCKQSYDQPVAKKKYQLSR